MKFGKQEIKELAQRFTRWAGQTYEDAKVALTAPPSIYGDPLADLDSDATEKTKTAEQKRFEAMVFPPPM